jgi:hypothetical protein
MKGIYGLGIAVALGLAGALFNFAYLNVKSRDVDKVYFIGIKPDVTVTQGERLQAEHLEPVGIPKGWVGGLTDFGVKYYEAKDAVIGTPVWRTISGPRLLLDEDLKAPPPQEVKLAEDELAWGIAVDARQFVTSLIVPGDYVSFLVPRSRLGLPTPAQPVPAEDRDDPVPADSAASADPPGRQTPASPTEMIGPFRVLAVGNRLGTAEVQRANRIPQMQENVMTIAVKVDARGELEPKAQKLANLLQVTDYRGVQILKHPKKLAARP